MKIASNIWQILGNARQNFLPVLLCLGLLVTAATAKTAVHQENEGENSATPNITFEPSATFQRMWIDYNITQGGQKGMRIHTNFTVYNMKGIDGYLALYFQKRDGTPLRDNNNEYNSADGTVAAYREITPGYQTAAYEDYVIFMPYDELDLPAGRFELRIDADVIYKQGGRVAHLTFYNFDYTNPGNSNTNRRTPTATFGRMWVDYNVTQGGRKGMLVHLKANVFDMKGQTGYFAFYFQHKDGTKLYTTNRAFRSNDSEREGQLVVYYEIAPGFDNTLYEDAKIFMPYDELNLRRGTYDLQMDVDLISRDGTLIQHLNFYDFWYEKN